jgi:hypothetical protein
LILRRIRVLRGLGVLGALLSAGCGDGLVDGAALDQPLFSIAGNILPIAGQLDPATADSSLELGIVWIDPAQQAPLNTTSDADLVFSEIAPDGAFTLNVTRKPDSSAIRWLKFGDEDGPELGLAWGEIVVYEDRNRDGSFGVGPASERSPILAPDSYRGFAREHVLIYVAQGFAEGVAPIAGLEEVTHRHGYVLGRIVCRDPDRISPIEVNREVPVSLELSPDPLREFPAGLRDCWNTHAR